jgi:hypothetical protein
MKRSEMTVQKAALVLTTCNRTDHKIQSEEQNMIQQ